MLAILMCTYNGERFLKEQLNSLLCQSFDDFIIYVHDDGSKDKTLEILNSYINQYPQKIVLMDDPIKHRGAGSSFMWLLENVESHYYMFCDQDDVWLPTKVEHTLNKIKEVELSHPNLPILIHTDLKLVDGNLKEIFPSFWAFGNFQVDVSKRKQYLGFGNIVTGCTMIINKKAKDIAFPYDSKLLHDYWLALRVAKYGIVDNLKEQTILYRQHGNNEAGAGELYKKRQISFSLFFKEMGDEYERCKECAGYGVGMWLYYRFLYFIYRHFR